MANDKKFELDPGFEEVSLDEGFEEVPLSASNEPVSDSSQDSSLTAQVPLTTRMANSLIMGPIGHLMPEISAGVRAVGEKIYSPSKDLGDLYQEKLKDPTELEKMAEAGGRGVAQGGSVGFSDEIIGAVGATGQKVAGLVSGQETPDWTELYRQYQLAEQAKNKEVAEENPLSYLGGELVGSAALGLATAGASAPVTAVGAGGKTLTGLRAAHALGGATGSAKYLGKLGGIGGAIGAATSAGVSEGNLDSIESRAQLMEDIKTGAKVGSVMGPAISVIGARMSKGAERIGQNMENRPFPRRIKQLWNNATDFPIEGHEQGQKVAARRLDFEQKDLTETFKTADDAIGNMFNEVVEGAQNAGFAMPFKKTEILHKFKDLLENNSVLQTHEESNKILKLFNRSFPKGIGDVGFMEPKELLELKWDLSALYNKLKKHELGNSVKVVLNEVDNLLGSMPEGWGGAFKKANELMTSYRGGILDKLVNRRYSSIPLDKRESVLTKGVEGLLDTLSLQGQPRIPGVGKLDKMLTNLTDLEKKNPGILETLGINLDDLARQIQKHSDYKANVGNVLGSNAVPLANVRDIAKSQALGQGATTYLGRATGIAQTLSQSAYKAGELFNAPMENIGQIADVLVNSNNPHAQSVGNYLLNAVQNKDMFRKNAALFIINQNPMLRNLISDFIPPYEE